jgi:rhamnulokinase
MAAPEFVACDFGAGSGRLILGTLSDSDLSLKEIHRFTNREVEILDHYYWDLPRLFAELKQGLSHLRSEGHREVSSIGVDTWGVDFGLIARDGTVLGNPVAYRDSRTDRMMEHAFELMPRKRLYQVTGIQFMQINTLFQLLSMVRASSPLLEIAEHLLMMPDLFNYLMTGEVVSEYTIASTSQLLDAAKKNWADSVFESVGLPRDIMPPIVEPGQIVGRLRSGVCNETGLDAIDVVAPACHDTASAVAAVPGKGPNWAFVSSGTWSLLGTEEDSPIINDLSLTNNFTNEGGFNGQIRFLRNNMGLWLLTRCRLAWADAGENVDYDNLFNQVLKSKPFKCIIDPDDRSFLNPPDMPSAIQAFCGRSGMAVPGSKGEFVRTILESLALKYRFILDQINSMRTEPVERLHIVGGGSQNRLLNQFTANACGIPVTAGPVEATALGNILIQAIAKGYLADLDEAREVVAKSSDLQEFEPADRNRWEEQYQNSKALFST